MLKRKKYLDLLINYKDINLIKVITGVRRCGKSTLLLQFKDYLISQKIDKNNIIYMNFESADWYDIDNFKSLYTYIKSKVNNKKLYILLDEVQNVYKWEKAVNSMLVDIDCDIYITGSNAYLLSSELTTLLAGRVITIKMFPFSFSEFLSLYPFQNDLTIDEKFIKYLQFGGLPMIVNMKDNENLISNYLEDVKDVVLKKDVITRNNIKDIALLDNLLRYMSSTIGSLITPSNIADFLNKNGMNTRNETIYNYLKMLENSFILYRVPRFELIGKQLLKTQGKYFIVDTGIKNIISGYSNYDSGSSLENVVYLELIRRGYEVYVGKYNDLEIDFVALKPNETRYYQVSKSLLNEKVENREKRSLLAIKDNHSKYILTMDKVKNKEIEGIKILNIIDFLTENAN